jgi:protein gp37
MGSKSVIEWTDATWNPSTGCTKVSSGCVNCYAERKAISLKNRGMRKYQDGFNFRIHPEALNLPLKWREPKMIFVNSMSDLFHEDMPVSFLDSCFDVMEKADWHIYQILTKRPERMFQYVSAHYGFKREVYAPDHIWMGVTVEHGAVKSRIDVLRQVPAKVRFVSFEPLLGPIGQLDLHDIQWIIVGGESGPNHREMNPEWAREIRDQAVAQKVPFLFK